MEPIPGEWFLRKEVLIQEVENRGVIDLFHHLELNIMLIPFLSKCMNTLNFTPLSSHILVNLISTLKAWKFIWNHHFQVEDPSWIPPPLNSEEKTLDLEIYEFRMEAQSTPLGFILHM